jgi:hypothetical protein
LFSIIRSKGRTGTARPLSVAALTGFALMAMLAGTAAAQSPQGHGPIRGIVPTAASKTLKTSGASSDLIFHGGSVLNGNTVYAVYWSPSNYPISGSYENLINRYFTDVAHSTGGNVYDAATQYGAGINGSTAVQAGSLSVSTNFGGAYIDGDPISNGCHDRATSVCVSDAQVVQELNKVVTAHQLSTGGNSIYFMFTPEGVGSCYSKSSCSFSQWCAYHSSSSSLLYANMAFSDTVPSACDAGYHPNAGIDPYADATISVVSHEHNEAITDPFGSAWYNSSGYEDGDLCAWNFGSLTGSGASAYNQVINGDHYALQQEWSNNTSRCVLSGL